MPQYVGFGFGILHVRMPATRREHGRFPRPVGGTASRQRVAHGWLSVERWLEPVARASTPHRRAQALASRPRPAPALPLPVPWHREMEMAGMARRIGFGFPAICHLSATSRFSRTPRCPVFSSPSSRWPLGSRLSAAARLLSRCPPRLFRCATPAAGADRNNRGGVQTHRPRRAREPGSPSRVTVGGDTVHGIPKEGSDHDLSNDPSTHSVEYIWG